jgi:hypothetical protein
MQNSHLLQVISDLSGEVEQMREVFRIRGWSLQQLGASVNNNNPLLDDSKRFSSEENKKSFDPEASPKRRHRPRPLTSPKFENVSLGSPNKTEGEDTSTLSRDQSPWPGNDQVSVLSNHKESTEEPVKKKRSKQRSRSHLTESNNASKKSSNSKPSVSSIEKEDSVVSSGNCFKNLFKRNKR